MLGDDNLMGYTEIRNNIYNEIEQERRIKIWYMCSKCDMFKDNKCMANRCINEIKKKSSVYNESSNKKCARIKRR